MLDSKFMKVQYTASVEKRTQGAKPTAGGRREREGMK